MTFLWLFLALMAWGKGALVMALVLDWLRPRLPLRRLAVGSLLCPLTLVLLIALALYVEWQLARDLLGGPRRGGRSRKPKQKVDGPAPPRVGFRSPKVGQ